MLGLKIIDKYLAKKFIVAVVFMLIITATISVIFDVSEKLEDFVRSKPSWQTVVFMYYGNFGPTIINLISPIVIFISALYFTSRLANQTEFLAMLAGGISYRRILRPYVLVAIGFCMLDMYAKNFLFPKAHGRVVEFEMRYVQKGYDYQFTDIHRRLDSNTFFYCQRVYYAGYKAFTVSIEKFKAGKLIYKLQAPEAEYDTVQANWKFRTYTIKDYTKERNQLEKGDSLRMKLSITMEDFGQKVKSIPTMTTPELLKQLKKEREMGDSVLGNYEVEFWRRIASPVDIIVLVLIAVGIASRKMRGGLGIHLFLGILIAVTHEMFARFSSTFAIKDNVPAYIVVWLPTLVFGILAWFILRRAQK